MLTVYREWIAVVVAIAAIAAAQIVVAVVKETTQNPI
jgi:hypothetical protein